jgi:hypothetical protein
MNIDDEEQAVIEDDEDILTEDEAPEVEDGDEDEEAAETDPAEASDEDPEEIIVTIGEESPSSEEDEAPEWVKRLRKSDREKTRRIKELEALVGSQKDQGFKKPGPKPTLKSVEYDADLFEKKLEEWHISNREYEQRVKENEERGRKETERWQSEIKAYDEQKASLKVRDFEDAEETVNAVLNPTQIAVLVDGAQSKALLMYALGKDEKRLAELSQITNPIKFAFAVARMETQLKTQSRKPAAQPEKAIKAKPPGQSADSKLERLRAEADRTGDLTKVIAYKRKLKESRAS